MPKRLNHKDTITIIDSKPTEYANTKAVQEMVVIKGTFLADTGFLHSSNQDSIDSDAVLYPDERNAFVLAHFNRLEGMYIIAPLFGGQRSESWYKITKCTVNRSHLLGNKIDNILCLLKKTRPLPNVS